MSPSPPARHPAQHLRAGARAGASPVMKAFGSTRAVGDQAEGLAHALRRVVERRLDRQLLVVEALRVDADPGVRRAAREQVHEAALAHRADRRLARSRAGPPPRSRRPRPWPSAPRAGAGSARSSPGRRRSPRSAPSSRAFARRPGLRPTAITRAPRRRGQGARTSGRSAPRRSPRPSAPPGSALPRRRARRRPAARPAPPAEASTSSGRRSRFWRDDARRDASELGVGTVPEEQVVAEALAAGAAVARTRRRAPSSRPPPGVPGARPSTPAPDLLDDARHLVAEDRRRHDHPGVVARGGRP